MKKLILCFFAMITVLTASAQDMSQTMAKYAEGCFLLREAIATKDFRKLIDAKAKFYGIKLAQFSDEDFSPVDSVSGQVIQYPTIMFTPEFASKLVKERKIILTDIKDCHLMRKGDGALFLWHASILPHSAATFKSAGNNKCELFLCSTENSDMSLSVFSDYTGAVQGTPIKNNSAWHALWDMPESPAEFTFTIANNGDEKATFVIAVNGD